MKIFSTVWFWFLTNIFALAALLVIHFSNHKITTYDSWNDYYSITSSLLAGGAVSFLFYFLVVYLPERRKRNIIKSNLKAVYRRIKKDIAYQIISASQKGGRTDLEADTETVERLLTVAGFKAAFEGGSQRDEGFYAFRNYIGEDVPEYRSIILSLKMLAKQIEFILHNYPITEEEHFAFFKRLELFLLRIKEIGPGYEEEKVLSRFIWEIYGGWSSVNGDVGHDIIEKMIDDI